MASPQTCNDKFIMIWLWVHETMRVFHDRLVSMEDRFWVTNYVTELINEVFKEKIEYKELFEDRNIIFGDFMSQGDISEWRYEEVPDQKQFEKVMSNYVSGFNIEYPNNKLELVLFKDALNHLSRISRILRQQRGNALLIGVGGCGKQTLTKLSAYISGSHIA